MKYDVYGLGNPLMDIIVEVEEEEIKELGLKKGTMHLIDYDTMLKILRILDNKIVRPNAAGSCPNSLRGLAKLGGRSVLGGCVGDDDNAGKYIELIQKAGVFSRVKKIDGLTGSSIIHVTPDGERTMTTFLGACRGFEKQFVDSDIINNSKFLYISGYMWDTDNQKQAALFAMEHKGNTKLVFNLADPSLVKRNKQDFNSLLKHIDILMANDQEIESLTGLSVDEAGKNLIELCEIVVITKGENGSVIFTKDKIIEVPSFKTYTLDTTGAGDMYVAGFLFGMSKGLDLEKCGRVASKLASCIVSQHGTIVQDTFIKETLEIFS